ncbi:MAG: phosphonate C-P lyase system protein PhnG [Syntrophomonadaceae bacterium]|nr:phosphonate C-P lyase system protein PhnG [Syntrophomonadaceae bacterium]
MNRKQRTEVLIKGSRHLSLQMATEVLNNYPVQVIEKPHHGLVMIKMREGAKNSLFYLGELLVTECKVQIGAAIGIGIVKGDEPELAFHLAVIDAAYNSRLPETVDWQEMLLLEEAVIAKVKEQTASHILKTQVNFETMDVKEQRDENGPGA